MKYGILLVANYKSQDYCYNLIYSIRNSGCSLPIKLIHFGGEAINSDYILKEVEFLTEQSFNKEAINLIKSLQTVLTDCPKGFLYRFLGWFIEWDAFIYVDNDVVALDNWEHLFTYLDEVDFIHADEEYKTKGIYEYNFPEKVADIFGKRTFENAFNAGFFIANKNDCFLKDIPKAIQWFQQHRELPKKHDQALLNIASFIGNWKTLNLCKDPYPFLSTWSLDYKHPLEIIQKIQTTGKKIIFLHYAGYKPIGHKLVDDLLYSSFSEKKRLKFYFKTALNNLTGIDYLLNNCKKLKKMLFK